MVKIKIEHTANGYTVNDGKGYITCDDHADAKAEALELAEQYKAQGEQVQIDGAD